MERASSPTSTLADYLSRKAEFRHLSAPPPDWTAEQPFIPTWERWSAQADGEGAWHVLRRHLPQLSFPIRAGSRDDPAYRSATLRGTTPSELGLDEALHLVEPETIELRVPTAICGKIPVILVQRREDFVTLLQALAYRNEPRPVSPSQGAAIISGYVNWSRVADLQRAWSASCAAGTWRDEWQRILPRKELYQDRLLLLSKGPYSGVPADEVGLPAAAWRRLSWRIRLDHEGCHELVKRLFGDIQNHLHDEILSDFAGLHGAFGRFQADLFLRLLEPRQEIYRKGLPEAEWRRALEVVRAAAKNLELLSHEAEEALQDRVSFLVALAGFDLRQMAAGDLGRRFLESYGQVRELRLGVAE